MSSRLWPLYNESELGEIPQPKWLVENHITDGFSVIYGPPKSGKTFVALDWALSMAAGQQWAGYQVEASPVLYVSGEGAGGLHRRITAWKQHRQVRSTRMYVIPFAARIGNPQHIEALQATSTPQAHGSSSSTRWQGRWRERTRTRRRTWAKPSTD
jgi:hypothetical protein